MKIRKRPYVVEKYSQDLIDKFKSPENMLKHARCDEGVTDGYFFISKKKDDLVGYIAFEDDMIIALEVSEDYQGRGYAGRLLKLAESRGADKLTVNKSNANAIEMYDHLGWKKYKEADKMLFMRKSES